MMLVGFIQSNFLEIMAFIGNLAPRNGKVLENINVKDRLLKTFKHLCIDKKLFKKLK